MLIKQATDIPSSDITPKHLYVNRRKFIGTAAATAAAAALGTDPLVASAAPAHGRKLEGIKKVGPFSTDEKPNTWEQITTYNNYYEFGTDKDSPSMLAAQLQDRAVDGRGRRRVQQEGRADTSRTSSRARRSRSASTAIAASKRGRW